MRRGLVVACLLVGSVAFGGAAADACGGLIGPGGAVNLTRTTTLAAHHWGVEHYITAFNYEGGGGAFGSIIPLPALPSKIEKGGAWTLQRLQRETAPQQRFAAASGGKAVSSNAVVVYETKVDALDLKVLRGGGRDVGEWAKQHGFRLPPDTPELLDFYASRSPYFLVAVFDAKAAKERGQRIGDGTPVHVSIPLKDPWVPLRILSLGKQSTERIDAEVFLLTDRPPSLLPAAGDGYSIERQVPASFGLMKDLRSDRGMEWMPTHGMTLTHLVVNASAPQLRYDLAINDLGGAPSRERAGLPPLATPVPTPKPKPPVPEDTFPAVTFYPPQAAPVENASSSGPFTAGVLFVSLAALSAAAFVLNRRTR